MLLNRGSRVQIVFLLLTAVLFFSSCSIMKKAGFEKRLYRPGFYFNSVSLSHGTRNTNFKLAHKPGKVSAVQNSLITEQKIEVTVPVIPITKQAALNTQSVTNLPETKPFSSPRVHTTEDITNTAATKESSLSPAWREILNFLLFMAIAAFIYLGLHALFPALSFIQLVLISLVLAYLLYDLIGKIFAKK